MKDSIAQHINSKVKLRKTSHCDNTLNSKKESLFPLYLLMGEFRYHTSAGCFYSDSSRKHVTRESRLVWTMVSREHHAIEAGLGHCRGHKFYLRQVLVLSSTEVMGTPEL